MATDLGDLRIAVIVAAGDAKATLKELGLAADRAADGAEHYKREQRSLDQTVRRSIGIVTGLIGAYYGVIQPLQKILTVGSDVQESMSKASQVFRENMRDVEAWATQYGEAIGRSRFELIQMAATLQDTFVPMGMQRAEAAELSKTLTELAVDVASFNNAQDTQVMEDFQSAIVGNHETVRRYGIIITEAQLKQEALNSGIIETERELTAQEKVQARVNLILNGTTDAQGDAARTADQYAQNLKGLQGDAKNASVAMSRFLMPAANETVSTVRRLVRAWTDWVQGLRETEYETSIRKLKELGVETIQYELTLARLKEVQAEALTVGLPEANELQNDLNNKMAELKQLRLQIIDTQEKYIQQGQSETEMRQRQEKLSARIALATGDAAATLRAQTLDERLRLQAKLSVIDALKEEEKRVQETAEELQNQLIIRQKHIAAQKEVQALEQAIAEESRPDEEELRLDQIDAETRALETQYEIVKAQQVQIKQQTQSIADMISLLNDRQQMAVAGLQQFTNAWIQAGIHGQDALQQMEAAFKSLLAQLAQRSVLYLLLSVFGGPATQLPQFGKFLLGSFGNITGAASGGAFSSPTLTMLAERGETELVMPEKKFQPVLSEWLDRAGATAGGNQRLLKEIEGLRQDLRRKEWVVNLVQNDRGVYEVVRRQEEQRL